jgi:cell division protein FtsB
VAQLREDNRNLNLGQVEWNKMWNELQADAHNLKSPVHAICNQNLTETLTAALEEKQRADKAESEAAQLRKNEAVFEKAIKDLRDDAQGTEMEKRLRGALMVAGIGEWTHWNAAIDLFVKAAQAQAHFARLAAERYDQLLEKDRTVAQLRAEVERLQGMLRDYIEQHNALRQQESESQLENRMLWNELTRALGATRVRALSEAILAARSQGAKEQGQ